MMRDCRINTIFEGSSEIMRLFIAREALDPHLKIGAAVLDRRLSLVRRGKAAMRSLAFYAWWYPSMWLPKPVKTDFHPLLRRHVRWCASATRRLARGLFHQMLRYGPALEKRQLLLGRYVEIGTELFAMSAACSRAQMLLRRGDAEAKTALELADYFCKSRKLEIERRFHAVRKNADAAGYHLAKEMTDAVPSVLSGGILYRSES